MNARPPLGQDMPAALPPLTLSAVRIDAFATVYPSNRRSVQAMGERVLWPG